MKQQRTRREQEREDRRQHMLRAATSVFAERGFRRSTLDEIAQRSEFGKGTIYNYFPDGKDEMLFAILDNIYDEMYAISVEAFLPDQNQPFASNLKPFVEAFLNYFLEKEKLFVIIMQEANRIAFADDPTKSSYFKAQYDRIRGVIEPRVEVAIQRGELKPFAARTVAHMILGNIHGYLRYRCLAQVGMVDPDGCDTPSADEAARFISEMLLTGLAQPTTGTSSQQQH